MQKAFIIAEISANHGHDINIAKQTILQAKMVGADAVKIQTYTPDTLTIDCKNEYFQLNSGTIWDGISLYDLYKQAYTPWEWHKELFAFAREHGVILFSTPFDKSAVDLLEECGNPIYKIASFEITDIPLVEYVATKKKPMIISTGIASQTEIEDAVAICHKVGNNDITLLQCTSEYPAKIEEANLLMMQDMKEKFAVKIGLSDHTMGSFLPVMAVAMGATVIEKHFILARNIGGPDASFSLTTEEFKNMVQEVRKAEAAMGKVDYSLTEKKLKSRKFARSLFVVESVIKGEVFTEKNIRSIRPGDGIAPKYIRDILGKKANYDIKRGEPVKFDMFI